MQKEVAVTPEEPLLNVTPQPLIEPEVIKGSENLKSSDLKTEPEPVSKTDPKLPECDHAGHFSVLYKNIGYAYCPKCGEKL